MKKNQRDNKNINLAVIYEKAIEGGYVAYVPTLQGCHTQGETLEETKKNIKEAITLYLECIVDEKKEIFLPKHEFVSVVNVKIPVGVNC